MLLEKLLSGFGIASHTTSKGVLQSFHVIEEAGGNLTEIETYLLSRQPRLLYWPLIYPNHFQIGTVREAVLYLLGKVRDAWGLFFRMWGNVWIMPNEVKGLLDVLLEAGLDPNFLAEKNSKPLLICALDGVCLKKQWDKEKHQEGDEEEDQEEISISDNGTGRDVPTWCLVELLIRKGADIYYIHLHEGAENWWNIWTPTAYAINWEVEEEWCAALRACGYDPNQVYEEDKRRRIDFIKLRGAKRTGVEVEDISSPSGLGLRQRKPYQA
jgi:hypothetical protein